RSATFRAPDAARRRSTRHCARQRSRIARRSRAGTEPSRPPGMTLDQGFSFAIVLGMMGLFVWGRWRYDVVALLALLASVATGIVPAEAAFEGFGDDILVIIASALLVSAAVARS